NSSGDCAASGPCVPAVHAAAGVVAEQPTVTPVALFETKSSRMRPAPPFPAPLAPSRPAAPGSPKLILPAAAHTLPPAPPRALPASAAGHARAHEALAGGRGGRAAEALAVHLQVALDDRGAVHAEEEQAAGASVPRGSGERGGGRHGERAQVRNALQDDVLQA